MSSTQKNNELFDRALHMAEVHLMYGDWLKSMRYTQLAFWLCRRNYQLMKTELKQINK